MYTYAHIHICTYAQMYTCLNVYSQHVYVFSPKVKRNIKCQQQTLSANYNYLFTFMQFGG